MIKKKTVSVKIPQLRTKTVKLTIMGTSPLLVNKFSEKAKREMAEKQAKTPKNAKAARDPKAEFEASLYHMPGKKNVYGIPASGIKNAIVSACRFVDGLPMSIATGAFHVHEDAGGLVALKGKPVLDERIVRIGKFGNKIATPRYRGRFDEWSCAFKIEYNQNVISAEQLVHLLDNAGFSIGLCEHRPEKRGSLGRFQVLRG
jgi:hypothetical protein